jgi:hypothetical protein
MTRSLSTAPVARGGTALEFRALPRRRPASRPLSGALNQVLWLALALTLAGGAQALAQQSQQQMPGQTRQQMGRSTVEFDQPDMVGEQKRLRLLNAERHKALVSDADKLLKLVSQLNAEINAAGSASLTPAQLRTLGEIQKLAHSVKSKMGTSVPGTPVFREPAEYP